MMMNRNVSCSCFHPRTAITRNGSAAVYPAKPSGTSAQTAMRGRSRGRAIASPMCRRSSSDRVTRCSCRNDPRQKQHPVRSCEGEERVADGIYEHRGEQHRPASDAVGQLAEQRGCDELHERVNAEHYAIPEAPGTEALRIERQDRHDDAEPDQVDQDCEEDDAGAG